MRQIPEACQVRFYSLAQTRSLSPPAILFSVAYMGSLAPSGVDFSMAHMSTLRGLAPFLSIRKHDSLNPSEHLFPFFTYHSLYANSWSQG